MVVVSSVHAVSVSQVTCLSNHGRLWHVDPGSAYGRYGHLIVAGQSPHSTESTLSDALLWNVVGGRPPGGPGGPPQQSNWQRGLVIYLRLVDAARGRLFPHQPSRELPTCQGTVPRLEPDSCSYVAYVYVSDSQLLLVHRCRPAWRHLCYGTYGEFIMNRGRRAAYHRTPDN